MFLVFIGRPALAAYLYDFTFTPTLGPVEAVSFEFSSPNFVTSGPLSIAPFAVIEGAHTQTITQGSTGLVDVSGTDIRCFVFGTANAVIGPGGCDIGVNLSTLSLFLAFNFTPLPASSMNGLGTYTTSNDQFLVWGGTDPDFPNGVFGRGNMSLTISQVPEPSSAVLVLSDFAVLLAMCGCARRSVLRNSLPSRYRL